MKQYGGGSMFNGIFFSDGDYYSIGTRNAVGEIAITIKKEKIIFPKWTRKVPVLRGLLFPIQNVLDLFISGKFKILMDSLISKELKNLIKNKDSFQDSSAWTIELSKYIIDTFRALDFSAIRRYHGAEHKILNCYEQGNELVIENIAESSKIHARCGTSLLGYILIVNIIAAIGITIFNLPYPWVIILFLVSLSFEIFELMYNKELILFRPLKKFGLYLQKSSTTEPTEEEIEVGVKAFSSLINHSNIG